VQYCEKFDVNRCSFAHLTLIMLLYCTLLNAEVVVWTTQYEFIVLIGQTTTFAFHKVV